MAIENRKTVKRLFILVLILAQLLVVTPSETHATPLQGYWSGDTADYAIWDSCKAQGWAGEQQDGAGEIDKGARVWSNAGSRFRFDRVDSSVNYWYCQDLGPGDLALTWGPPSVPVRTVINLYYPWGVGDPNKYDVWNVASHEFGHWLPLDHDGDPEATMWGLGFIGDTKRRILHQSDMSNIRQLYGTDGYNWDFHIPGYTEGWSAINFAWTNGVNLDPGADSGNYPGTGAWIGIPNNDPQFLSPGISFDASTYKYLIVRMADQNAIHNRWFQLYWDNGSGFSEVLHTDYDFWQHVNNPEGGPNAWYTYSINLYNRHSGWRGTIYRVRFDPILQSDGLSLGMDFLRFSTRMGNLRYDCTGPPDC